MRAATWYLLSMTALALANGCGDDGDTTKASPSKYPYDEDQTVIIGGNSETPVATPNGDACIDPDQTCVRPQDTCGDNGTADVVLDADGKVVDVICYPTSGAPIETIPAARSALAARTPSWSPMSFRNRARSLGKA